MGDPLFDWPVVPPPPIGPRPLSYTERLTIRRRASIARGVHPLTKVGLRAEGGTCGECVHVLRTGGHARSFYKCDLVPITFGPGTDLRLSWPVCVRFEAQS